MNYSFFSGAVGAWQMQNRMDVIANNISNVNTQGFKAKNGVFTELVYKNLNAAEGTDTRLIYGAAAKMNKTDTDFSQGVPIETGEPLDYLIMGEGFFAVYNPETEDISYTRDGSFKLSRQLNGQFYLTNSLGEWVLDERQNPITADMASNPESIGIYVFEQKNGMENIGDNKFTITEKNGAPVVFNGLGRLTQGYIEESNVDLAKEITRVIETQRAYQLSLRMVQTTDEIENTINNLR